MGKTGVQVVTNDEGYFRFNCDWRRRLLATSFTATCEMVVTDRNDDGQQVLPIRGRQSFDSRDAFYDKVAFFMDPDFWEDYNIIEPTAPLDRAINKLLTRYPLRSSLMSCNRRSTASASGMLMSSR